MYYEKTLSNGIRVMGEKIPHFRSVSVGYWIGAGSVNETPEINGISHFIEHMLFKGTHNRSAKEIASVIDAVGGQLNAFTAKECTCYYIKAIDEHLELSINVLSDMLLNSKLDPKELDKEKSVVQEEILMVEDAPEDVAQDLLCKAFYGEHPLSMTILGSQENIASFNAEKLNSYIDSRYKPSNIVVAVAGNFDEQGLEAMLEKELQGIAGRSGDSQRFEMPTVRPQHKILSKDKDTEQMALSMGFPGVCQSSEDLSAALIFNNILGGGMSSRLFQRIREERGLVYSIYSYPATYTQGGMFSISCGMKPENTREVAKLVVEEVESITAKGVTDKEFRESKEQLKGNYILGLESTSSRMSSLGKSKLLLGKAKTQEEVIAKIEAVTLDDVNRIGSDMLNMDNLCAALVGKVKKIKADELFK